jgi:predicted AlkP superfamily pyrophosphatase or phosphodiesterase
MVSVKARPLASALLPLASAIALGLPTRANCQSDRPSPAARPPVLIIAIDAFRRGYLDSFPAPAIMRLAKTGVFGAGMRPAFPTVTFPNHVTLVTGRWPEDHQFRYEDRGKEKCFIRAEPIWVTAVKQGLKTATMFWPASECNFDGYRPTYWHMFDDHFPEEKRVAQILEWLDMPAKDRPAFMTLYFDAHAAGSPWSDKGRAVVERVDGMIGLLTRGLESRRLVDSVNIVITADHGYGELDATHITLLSTVLDTNAVDVEAGGFIARLRAKNGDQDAVIAAVKRLPHVRVYRREDIPEHMHFRNDPSMVQWPIFVVADEGWRVAKGPRPPRPGESAKSGGHGMDNAYESERVPFIAHGPAFRPGTTLPVFDTINIYSLLAHLLGITPQPNSGKLDVFRPVLR